MTVKNVILIEEFGDNYAVKTTWLATCEQCGPEVTQPFDTDDSRDIWAGLHISGTGHTVRCLIQITVTAS